MASEIWIPDISLFLTCRYTREYLACNHAARHEFLARNANEWPNLAKAQFFVQADEAKASLDEFLGDEGNESDYSGEDDDEEEVITYGRYDHEVQITRRGGYDKEEDVVIWEDYEDEDEDEDFKEVDDEADFARSRGENAVPSIEHDDDEYTGDEAARSAETDEEKKRDEDEWAEVMEQIEEFFRD